MNLKKYISVLTAGLSLAVFTSCGKEIPDAPANDIYLWSHNDYEQEEPLQAALDLGFQMVEADIHLIDGELYVVHDYPENPNETPLLHEMYLTPLKQRIEQNNGEVLAGESLPFYLVIDVKTDAKTTFEALLQTLEPYKELFYRKENGEWIEGPVRLLISGNRPVLGPETENRIAFLDGRFDNLGKGFSSDLYPLISDSWFKYFTWDGTGDIPGNELQKLHEYVSRVHNEGKMIRFWGTPDREQVWKILVNSGVDVINVDDLEGMKNFMDASGR